MRGKRHIFMTTMVFLAFVSISQTIASVTKPVKYRKLYFYHYGLAAYDESAKDSCEEKLKASYGFDYKRKAGCVASYGQDRRWKRHNARIEAILIKRHGEGWYETYKACLAQCHGRQ